MEKNKKKLIPVRIFGIILTIIVCYLFLKGTRFSKLVGYFFYMSVACTLLPLPTPPFVIKIGEFFHPGIVALVGAIANCIAGFIEYHFLTWLFSKLELQKKIQNNWYFQKFADFFRRSAFICIVVTGFIPLYMEPFRIAAILTRFVLPKYLLAIFIGKLPRYYLIAMIGDTYQISAKYFILIVILLFMLPGIWLLFIKIFRIIKLRGLEV